MLDWLKNINKDYPEFWKLYLSKFESKSNRFVVLSIETTGLRIEKDVILSIGSFSIIDDNVIIGDSFEASVAQYKFFRDNGISQEYSTESYLKKMVEYDAITSLINYIGNAILVGHHINFDIEIINAALDRMDCGRLKNEALDIDIMHKKLTDTANKEFSLDELCSIYKVPNSEKISSTVDAYKIALIFLKLKSRLKIK